MGGLGHLAVQLATAMGKVPLTAIDDSWSKVVAKRARYRFVIDMSA